MAIHPNLHDQDFYAWALRNAALLRDGRLSEIDIEHVAEELESMGRSERRELVSRLAILFAHLLKWANQSGRRSSDPGPTARGLDNLQVHLVLFLSPKKGL
jgi:hypothetical protein